MSSVSKYEWNKYQEQRNGTYEPDRHVQFVSYDGKWPNLCSGKLTKCRRKALALAMGI